MARKVRPATLAVVGYVPPDDDCVGAVEEEYQEYLATADEAHLKLNGKPGRYWFRPMSSRLWGSFVAAVTALRDESDNVSASQSLEVVSGEIMDGCLVGCDEHPVVTKINADGSFEYKSYEWTVGKKAPDGLLDLIKEDKFLVASALTFLAGLSSLTEKEKNR